MGKLAGLFNKRNRDYVNSSIHLLLALFVSISLAACSGGDVTAPATTGGGASGGGSTTPVTDNITMGAVTFGVTPLAAFGTTSVSVDVLNNGVPYTTPVTVNFTSPCASSIPSKANLTASTSTVNGVATVSYVDNACAGSDKVTASITGGPSKSATLTVTPPSSGSITFVSATPTTINLRGTGGTEISRVTFKVFDVVGNPIGNKTVDFTLNTNIGGISLSSDYSITDANGVVYVDVHAGTVGTPVRVKASTITDTGISLSTQSSQLVISTGLPDQDSFTLSNQTYNMEGLKYTDTTTTLTVQLSDHFNNPVPDDTAVFFTTEGGSITPSCLTKNGSCTATLTSTDPKPTDGRVTVLAYAVGEESFKDLDGDGLADLSPNETVDDMPEAWLDTNFDGVHDADEPITDFNGNFTYDGPDGKFNTNLCNETVDPKFPGRISSPGSCSAQKTLHVRKSLEVVFSGSFVNTAAFSPTSLALSACGATDAGTLTIVDENGNPMPAETTIDLTFTTDPIAATDGTSSLSFVVNNSPDVGNSTTEFPFYYTGSTDCATKKNGTLKIKVETPLGNVTNIEILTSAP